MRWLLLLYLCLTAWAFVDGTSFALLLDANAGGKGEGLCGNYDERMAPMDCHNNWEVNACDRNCSIRIPLLNENDKDIEITDVKLRCVDWNSRQTTLSNGERTTDVTGEIFLSEGRDGVRTTDVTGEIFLSEGRDGVRTSDVTGTISLTEGRDGVLSFAGGSAFTADVIECPAGVSLRRKVVVRGDVVWTGGDISGTGRRSGSSIAVQAGAVLEIAADISEDVRVLVTVESTDKTTNTNSTSHVLVDLMNVDLATILNKPLLCCLKSVRQRAALGKIMADALAAFEDGDASKALDLLKLFISFATSAECVVDDGERVCLQEAIAAAIAGGRLIAAEFGLEGLEESADDGDFLRRSGEAEAAAMAYRKSVGGGVRSTSIRGGSVYSYNWALARTGRNPQTGKEIKIAAKTSREETDSLPALEAVGAEVEIK